MLYNREFDMKICPKCSKEHSLNGNFCSRSCANSRTFSQASKEKKRVANSKFYNSLTDDEKRARFEMNKSKYDYDDQQRRAKETKLLKSWNRPHEEMSREALKRRVLHESNYRCKECGIGEEWQGKQLVLELDHIDGDNQNNKPENLRILCPNCHSQTHTFRARNIKINRIHVDLVELEKNLRIHLYATPALRAMGLANSPKRIRIANKILEKINSGQANTV